MTHPRFDANQFPLTPGVRLLEASAGTGKTFALAHLVLRLLSEGPTPLSVEQLLVVTFTEAAATELRDRIAHRLQDALRLLQSDHPREGDGPLMEWLESQHPERRRLLEGRLLQSLERLDCADITTIHGFCRRTLQRQALEAGLGPAVSLEQNGHERLEQIVHDYWQQHVIALPIHLLAGLHQKGIQPDVLTQSLRALDGDPGLQLDALPDGITLEEPLHHQLPRLWERTWQDFLEHWPQAETLENGLAEAAQELKTFGATYSPYRLKPKLDRVQKVQTSIDSLEQVTPGYDAVLAQSDLQKYFHPGTFTKAAAPVHGDQVSLPEQALMEAVASLVDGLAETLLHHFCHWARNELVRRRERCGQMSFGQLLQQLDPGPGNQPLTPLLQAVATRYRAALIDEFQDTDPIQWQILRSAFGAKPARHLLVMVGDPKQAIYRFRGGDLDTYRTAANEADDCYGLFENRRSSATLVRGLNALMKPGLARTGLMVPAVEARADKGQLTMPDGESALQLLNVEPDRLEEQVAAYCQQLLEKPCTLHEPNGARTLQPEDICVLVGQHAQAEALRSALELRQLPTRLVSKGDVFETMGATALQRLLDALAQPGHEGRLRLLAASALLGWSASEIRTADQGTWDCLAGRLNRLAERLPRLGLTAVLAQLQGSQGVARLSLRGRVLADLQQCAELVQEQMHRFGLGAAQAGDWLRRQRLQDGTDVPEAHRCRSDAAESAIAVVTVHRSKGLEYPVVICPYLWKGSKAIKASARQVGRRWTPPGTDQPHLDLHCNPHWGQGRHAAQQDKRAQEAEAERLAYVACTRAQHLLVLGWPGPERAETGNPLSQWLTGEPDGASLPLTVIDLDIPGLPPHWQPPKPAGDLALGPMPSRSLDSRWGRASYSAWAHAKVALPPEMRDEGRDNDGLINEPISPATKATPTTDNDALSWSALGPLARFPRGAGPGEALHRILERIDYGVIKNGDLQPWRDVITQELPRAGLNIDWSDSVLEGLVQLVQTPMGSALGSCRLADLVRGEWMNEMNFDLPLAQDNSRHLVRSLGLSAVFENHSGGLFNADYGHHLKQLEVASRGFLTGSIDLLFCWEGKWWVADWKSNWLGQRDDMGDVQACGPRHYSQKAMVDVMTANHYPLQAHLYVVALHRYLSWRLRNYDPAIHLGGYAYIFLRGVPGDITTAQWSTTASTPGVLVDQPSIERVIALDQLLREGQP